MNTDNNIITIRKRNIDLAHEAFTDLMAKTELILNTEAKANPKVYKSLNARTLEPCAVEKIKLACTNSPFDENEVKLVSGQKFPDIVAENFYGIEVKSTKENHWTSTGSSILESTRVESVDDIYMLFGKLGGDIPEFKCRPYQDVLYDIAVTHSPRYLINMELPKAETIFAKMDTTYDDFRLSSDSISQARRYYRELAIKEHRQEMPWWITNDNVESPHSFTIKLWNSISTEEKRKLKTMCMALFPEALNPAPNNKKYNNTTLWLCSCKQIVFPNIRDMYSAGGKITHVEGLRLKTPLPHVFYTIVDYSEDIKEMLNSPSRELLMMIQDYNPTLLEGGNMYETWVNICCEFAKSYPNIHLREWIENKPKFELSKK